MNLPLLAAQLCGMAPLSQSPVWPLKPIVSQETAQITFMGFDLTLEIDCDGRIEGILSPDGTECYSLFEAYTNDLDKLIEKKRKASMFEAAVDRGQERYEERMCTA